MKLNQAHTMRFMAKRTGSQIEGTLWNAGGPSAGHEILLKSVARIKTANTVHTTVSHVSSTLAPTLCVLIVPT